MFRQNSLHASVPQVTYWEQSSDVIRNEKCHPRHELADSLTVSMMTTAPKVSLSLLRSFEGYLLAVWAEPGVPFDS
jgi:hypothetical protein